MGAKGKVRRQRTLKNVTYDQALAAWKTFRSDLETGRAIEGPLTVSQFVAAKYDLIAKNHASGTRKTQSAIINNHLLRYFGDDGALLPTPLRAVTVKVYGWPFVSPWIVAVVSVPPEESTAFCAPPGEAVIV